MTDGLFILGIRHHGPGSARSVAAALDAIQPQAVLVEGPPDADALIPLAASVARQAAEVGLRTRIAGPELGTLGSRIRSSRLVPYQAVIGKREATAGQVAIRLRDGRRLPPLPAVRALTGIAAHVAAHRTELWDATA